MSAGRFDRFRRLERPRAAGEEQAPAATEAGARIEGVAGPDAAAPASAPASGGELERFRAPPERSLELDLGGQGVQPFVRCAACETDNHRSAARCTTCGADLDTEAVRQFNQRLWAARQVQAAAEAEAGEARRAELEAEAVREAALRRQAAETLAREVGNAERRRLEREGFGPGWSGPDWGGAGGDAEPAVPLGLRWLRALPPGWQVPAGLALLAAPIGLFVLSPLAGLVAGAALIALFSPPRWHSGSGWRS